MKRKSSEFDRFDQAFRALIDVPHNKIQEKLAREKAEKSRKKLRASSGSREVGDRD